MAKSSLPMRADTSGAGSRRLTMVLRSSLSSACGRRGCVGAGGPTPETGPAAMRLHRHGHARPALSSLGASQAPPGAPCLAGRHPYGCDRVVLHGRVVLEDGPQGLFAGKGQQRGLGGDLTDPLVPLLWPESCETGRAEAPPGPGGTPLGPRLTAARATGPLPEPPSQGGDRSKSAS